ncbi:Concanavalin A-like lectin/glucanase domain containing protein, partial [Parasponia andersonii]
MLDTSQIAAALMEFSHGKSGAIKAAIMIAATVFGIGILIVVLLCFLRKKSPNPFIKNVEAFLRNYGPLQVRRYSYSDIRKMTNSFKEILGQVGFEDKCLVAVNLSNQSKGDDGQEFINEVATISRTSH